MKNRNTTVLILITCVFAAFTLGFLVGRTTAPGDTIVAQVPVQTRAAEPPAETTSAVTTLPPVSATPTVTTSAPEAENSGLININTATLDQLDSLPGIGPVLAQRIIDYRQQHGPFTAISQLTLVDGIGEKRLAAIIDLITIG